MVKSYSFQQITSGQFELVLDAIYQGGTMGNAGDDPISKIMNVGNQGGFRIKKSKDRNNRLPAYVILYTSGAESEWPDYLDLETGVFLYYGDNRTPGRELHDTHKKGNLILRDVFLKLQKDENERRCIPPFFIFEKTGNGRDVRFRGLSAPGVKIDQLTKL